MRVLRVYHGGRDPAHRRRERALVAAGVDLTLVVPSAWPEGGAERELGSESFDVVELDVERPGDVNRHRHTDDRAVQRLLAGGRWDVLDLHEEPVALVTRQWLAAAPAALPVALYTAQNIDKRFPPPFAGHEIAALRRADALYPCSRQAGSVARGKGFTGPIGVLPLGHDPELLTPGRQRADDDVVTLALVGRMVPEKGVVDAVRVLAAVAAVRPARLLLVGEGPALADAEAEAVALGVADDLVLRPWLDAAALAAVLRETHVVLVPSRTTARWVEQFGRTVVEAHASGAVVAAYAGGALPEVVDGAGVLAAEGDVTGLARRVVALLRDADGPTGFDALRAAGLEAAARRTWDAVARGQVAVYEDAVRRPAPVEAGRVAARRELGPTAPVAGQVRPFALPVLRGSPTVGRALGMMVDVLAGSTTTRG